MLCTNCVIVDGQNITGEADNKIIINLNHNQFKILGKFSAFFILALGLLECMYINPSGLISKFPAAFWKQYTVSIFESQVSFKFLFSSSCNSFVT